MKFQPIMSVITIVICSLFLMSCTSNMTTEKQTMNQFKPTSMSLIRSS